MLNSLTNNIDELALMMGQEKHIAMETMHQQIFWNESCQVER